MTPEVIFLIQAVGVVGIGAFIGEFHRSATSAVNVSPKIFIANFLAGSFLALIVSYLMYHYTKNRPISLVTGAFLAYQDEKFLKNLVRTFLKQLLDKKE